MTLAYAPIVLRFSDGGSHPLALDRWRSVPPPEEIALMDRAVAPVLDVGCGPGRHVVELAGRGMIVLGIDTSPAAVSLTRERGGPALLRSVFSAVPGTGRWMTALLMDGNIGIGGDPVALLVRVRGLLSPRGRALVELDPPGSTTRSVRARIECGEETSAWFPWAVVSATDAERIATRAGFGVAESIQAGKRWFAVLER